MPLVTSHAGTGRVRSCCFTSSSAPSTVASTPMPTAFPETGIENMMLLGARALAIAIASPDSGAATSAPWPPSTRAGA
eukprot:scaffold36275_cov154-Isochrysis_galbana.AAC.31